MKTIIFSTHRLEVVGKFMILSQGDYVIFTKVKQCKYHYIHKNDIENIHTHYKKFHNLISHL